MTLPSFDCLDFRSTYRLYILYRGSSHVIEMNIKGGTAKKGEGRVQTAKSQKGSVERCKECGGSLSTTETSEESSKVRSIGRNTCERPVTRFDGFEQPANRQTVHRFSCCQEFNLLFLTVENFSFVSQCPNSLYCH